MLRTFAEHAIRPVAPLDGRWDFITAPELPEDGDLPEDFPRTMQVPSAWETTPGLENYRGTAWYRTGFVIPDERAARIVFGGVSHTGTVIVDGEQLATHHDAFTPWEVIVSGLEPGPHELVVQVDNGFGEQSALHIPNDYYTYGGITRPVELQFVPEAYIETMTATPEFDGHLWGLDLRVRVANWSLEPVRRRVVVWLGEEEADLGLVDVPAGGTVDLTGCLEELDVAPWTPAEPSLYVVQAVLLDESGEEVDDQADRIGFREVEVRGKELLLNGEPIRLRGANRHEDDPMFGCALPLQAMVRDLELMGDLGFNFVRTCHYPNDMRFLDLCDEMGFCVWEESHARSVDFSHPRFDEQIAASTEEMVRWHANHPSILMWGCLNECPSETEDGKAVYQRVLGQLRRLDSSRPITFASNRLANDLCLGDVDIVAFNLYPAWYGGRTEGIRPQLDELLEWVHSDASGAAGKPLIISEFGAGGIYGNRQSCRAKWSEEYQAEALDACLGVYLYHPDVMGTAIWQFCDVRVTEEQWAQKRPRCMNNKGIVDEYRRPKLAYDTVRRRMRKAARKQDR